MKKLMLVAAVVLGTVAVSFAQADVNTSVSLVQGVSITAVAGGTLDFGELVVGTDSTRAAKNGAQFKIVGAGGYPIVITAAVGTMVGSGTQPSVGYTYAYSGTDAASEGSDVTLGSSISGIHLSGSSTGGGQYLEGDGYLGIGGTVTTTGATPGAYTQTVTLTVAY